MPRIIFSIRENHEYKISDLINFSVYNDATIIIGNVAYIEDGIYCEGKYGH